MTATAEAVAEQADPGLHVLGEIRKCPKCRKVLAWHCDDVAHGRARYRCECGVSVSYSEPELRREEAGAFVQEPGGWEDCVVKCGLYGTADCRACPIPDKRGAARCPKCNASLYPLGLTEDGKRTRWACDSLKACGRGYQFPLDELTIRLTDPKEIRRQTRLDRETAKAEAEHRREQDRQRRESQAADPRQRLTRRRGPSVRGSQTP